MEKATISIVYHSTLGHTKTVAELLKESMSEEQLIVQLLTINEAMEQPELLHRSGTIVFGCTTSFGNVSGPFKMFMDWTYSFWYKQLWKDKLAAGFTVCSTVNGDKLNTLVALSLFAAQHSMIWISQGIMPRFISDEQTDGQNRMASYLGLMTQSKHLNEPGMIHPGDALTTELFARRITGITKKFNHQR